MQRGNNQLETAPYDENSGGLPSKKERTDPDPGKETDPEVNAEEGLQYDVFLNFRGTDYRETFIDCLYHRLDDAGVCTFKDDEELRVGKEIGPELMRAIKQSKISIPIFSKNYASSKWCLKEVTEMVKRMDEKKHIIMPIFLDVTPNEVQHQTGSYAESFSQHEEKYDSITVQEWRGALSKVVQLKGLELQKEANGKHGEFIKLVLARVLNSLKKAHLNVNEEILVGLDHKIEAVKRLLEVGKDGVKIVGIWGMGGIGKTTLAKVVYNQMLDQFQSSCFLNDIRESSKNKDLAYLQSKLVSDILNEERKDFANVDEGIKQLQRRIGGKKAIILLDDIDHIDQFNALAGNLVWFGPGSRIIITTRERKVLDQFGVRNIYEVMPLSENPAFELFCKHAFLKGSPSSDFLNLSWDIVRATGMLPLALEVVGSSLSVETRCIKTWQATLKKLRAKPMKEVQDKLRISYDTLEITEKQIFLDIACMFIGMDTRITIPMWDDCNWFPQIGIQILILKSLIKITDENKFWMHDQLRDLGREIVEGENYRHPGSRSRLWRSEEAIDVLYKKEGTAKVEAINFLEFWPFQLEGDHFRNLSNLRILKLNIATLGGDFKGVLAELRWLRWQVWKSDPIPTNLDLRNLIFLDLSSSNVSEDWGGWRLMKVASKLKILDLTCCQGLTKTPEFSSFPALERLILHGSENLLSVDPSIMRLNALVSLDLMGCESMQALPNLEHLTNLEELYLGRWEKSLFNPISKVPGLQGLTSLETLKIGRSSITHLDGLEMLERLTELEIRSTPIESLPNLSKLKRLAHITLVGCKELRQVEEGFEELESLERLTISSCQGLVTLPDLSKLRKLKSLIISQCDEITEIRGLGHLESLERLMIESCEMLILILYFRKWCKLQSLNISWTGEIIWIDELGGMESLETLSIVGEYSILWFLPNMSNLRRLRFLEIQGLSNLTKIVGLEGLDKLETLKVSNCRGIKQLPDLSKLHGLKSLTIKGCNKVTEVRGLGDLESLEKIEICGFEALESLPNMSKFRRLRSLRISQCSLGEIAGLEELNSLQSLSVSHCNMLKLPNLSTLHELHKLEIEGCNNVTEVAGLEELNSLQSLSVSHCNMLKLPNLSTLHELHKLEIEGCNNVTEVEGLIDLQSLESIRFVDCTALMTTVLDMSKHRRLKSLTISGLSIPREIVGLEELDNLEDLEVSVGGGVEKSSDLSKFGGLQMPRTGSCSERTEVQGLGDLESLDHVEISNRTALGSLLNVSKLQRLGELKIRGLSNLAGIVGLEGLERLWDLRVYDCERLTEIQGLGDLKSLRFLKIHRCRALQKLPDLAKLQELWRLEIEGCDNLTGVGLDRGTKI